MVRVSTAVAVAVLLALVPAARGAVVLNEVMADPARDWSPTDGDDVYDSLDDEWVEIYNTGPGAVNVTGWRLTDASGDWRFGFQGTLPAGSHIVVYGNESYAWEDANGFPRSGLSLNNSGDTVTLVAADLVTVMDQVVYTATQVLDDRAYGRLPDGGPEWQVFDGLNPTSPPTKGIVPSPGAANQASPVEQSSWGTIKALFE